VRAVVQRVGSASVTVGGQVVGAIGPGLCALVGVTHTDDEASARNLARRIWTLRIFEDDAGLTNLSAEDLGLEIMVVSQFTLYADTTRGRRPSFIQAARPEQAEPLVEVVLSSLRAMGAATATGRFGSSMALDLVNDGPFTVLLET
jgi:D-tyrosyl-tRNA(Tyr) deacylase